MPALTVERGTTQTLECIVTGASGEVDVTFSDISGTISSNPGTYEEGSQTATLQLEDVLETKTYTCSVKSKTHPKSENQLVESVVTVFGGFFNIINSYAKV